MSYDFPILEFDGHSQAIINPLANNIPAGLPEACLLCFFSDLLNVLADNGTLIKVGNFQSKNPVYLYTHHDGNQVAVVNPLPGAVNDN